MQHGTQVRYRITEEHPHAIHVVTIDRWHDGTVIDYDPEVMLVRILTANGKIRICKHADVLVAPPCNTDKPDI